MVDVLLTGLFLSAVYGLVAVGISVTWSGLGLFNLAQGSSFAVGAYFAYFVSSRLTENGLVLLMVAALGGALVGALVYCVVYLPLEGRTGWLTRGLIATLALDLLARNVLLEVAGPGYRSLPPIFGDGTVSALGTVIRSDVIGTLAATAIIGVAALLVVQRFRVGLGVRILHQNAEGAALVGLNRRWLAFGILAVSGALAGLASMLLSQTFVLNPQVAQVPMIKGMVVALLGGLGSLRGAFVAALIVGMTEALTADVLGQQYVLIVVFAVIAAFLLVRPRGVGGVLEVTRV